MTGHRLPPRPCLCLLIYVLPSLHSPKTPVYLPELTTLQFLHTGGCHSPGTSTRYLDKPRTRPVNTSGPNTTEFSRQPTQLAGSLCPSRTRKRLALCPHYFVSVFLLFHCAMYIDTPQSTTSSLLNTIVRYPSDNQRYVDCVPQSLLPPCSVRCRAACSIV